MTLYSSDQKCHPAQENGHLHPFSNIKDFESIVVLGVDGFICDNTMKHDKL